MMNPVPIDVRPPSPSDSPAALPSGISPRTCTTAARARSARSARPAVPLPWRGAPLQTGGASRACPSCPVRSNERRPTAIAAIRRIAEKLTRWFPTGRSAIDASDQVMQRLTIGRRDALLRTTAARTSACVGGLVVGSSGSPLCCPSCCPFVEPAADVVGQWPGGLTRPLDQLLRLLGLADGAQMLEQGLGSKLDRHAEPGERGEPDQGDAQFEESEQQDCLSAASGLRRGTRSVPRRGWCRVPAAFAADPLPLPDADRPKRARSLSARSVHDHQKNRPALITCPIFTGDREPSNFLRVV